MVQSCRRKRQPCGLPPASLVSPCRRGGAGSHKPKATLNRNKGLGVSQADFFNVMHDTATKALVAAWGCKEESRWRCFLPHHTQSERCSPIGKAPVFLPLAFQALLEAFWPRQQNNSSVVVTLVWFPRAQWKGPCPAQVSPYMTSQARLLHTVYRFTDGSLWKMSGIPLCHDSRYSALKG